MSLMISMGTGKEMVSVLLSSDVIFCLATRPVCLAMGHGC